MVNIAANMLGAKTEDSSETEGTVVFLDEKHSGKFAFLYFVGGFFVRSWVV